MYLMAGEYFHKRVATGQEIEINFPKQLSSEIERGGNKYHFLVINYTIKPLGEGPKPKETSFTTAPRLVSSAAAFHGAPIALLLNHLVIHQPLPLLLFKGVIKQ